MSSRDSGWIHTHTGGQFWPLDPRPEDVRIEDIAHALSNLCRYTGHCRDHYSVAQHSVLVSNVVAPEHAMWGLMHDAAEAYLGDIAAPWKGRVMVKVPWATRDLAPFAMVESRVLQTIAIALELPWPMSEPTWRAVFEADLRMLMTEKRDLLASSDVQWRITHEPYDHVACHPWTPRLAECLFLQRYKWLRLCAQDAAPAAAVPET